MTTEQKLKILEMRRRGLTYSEIADVTGTPKNTVKTVCRRNRNQLRDASEETGIKENREPNNQCEYCHKPLKQRLKQKPRRFCDDACRLGWWKAHRDRLNRKALYPTTCAHCGKSFDSYGNKNRKYCCHGCYIDARFGGDGQGRYAPFPVGAGQLLQRLHPKTP